ncbi:DNA polymerase III subunit delta [Helicobacter cappadocius]|uniref:DNA polymerase III subunit delta n=1 Tax=Helicobacter cappadocius TaxID=3063998 RepID=A0AA90TBL7_9HELI|nr:MULTISPECIES: DNA polymerase III subunit delta [unclassified Helicobacter]MDO7252853.1 DNA polymerase III subunit delta [Helicobacter sp. faydin-H75]MDP2538896.1 DNA polymerase III subunit delta [Helicobacter sp. faydin-H76]
MYKKDLDKLLEKSFPRATLLYGESNFLISYYSEKIARKITDKSNKTTFYYSDYDFRSVMDILGQSSLFGDESLVVLKLDKKLPKKDIDGLLNAIAVNTNNSLIIEFYRSDSKTNAEYAQDFRTFASAFKGQGVIDVRFFAPNFYECIALLRERANELNLDIQDRLLGVILNLQSNDLSIAHNELEKFTIFDRSISIEDIHKLSYGLGSVSIDELYNAIFEKKDALEILHKIQEEGLDDIEILREMERYFYQLFLFFAYIKSNGTPNAKDILGFSPPQIIVDKLASRAIKIKEEGYQKIFEMFRKWRNVSMKGEKNFSLSVLIKLQAYIR